MEHPITAVQLQTAQNGGETSHTILKSVSHTKGISLATRMWTTQEFCPILSKWALTWLEYKLIILSHTDEKLYLRRSTLKINTVHPSHKKLRAFYMPQLDHITKTWASIYWPLLKPSCQLVQQGMPTMLQTLLMNSQKWCACSCSPTLSANLPAKVWKDHQLLDLLYKIWGWNRYGKNVLQLTSRNVGSKLWLKTSRTKIGFGGTRRSATMKIPITCINPHPNHYPESWE